MNTENSGKKLPPWIRVKVSCGEGREKVRSILDGLRLNTVCASARCPNLNECWHKKTATFMIMGNECTRNCRFCAVEHNPAPAPPEEDEPERVALAARRMDLRYIVVTSVTRDDLPDGGSSHFAKVIRALKDTVGNAEVEVLTPDFNADVKSLETVLNEKPAVFNHNVETVERLSGEIRSRAVYRRSLEVLGKAVEISAGEIPVKSGLMVGMGESDGEVEKTIRDLRSRGVDILTIGQYLPPSEKHWKLHRYVEPEKFGEWAHFAREIGFSFVASAPLVRSSYKARELVKEKNNQEDCPC